MAHFLCGIAAVIYHAPTLTYLIMRRASTKDVGAGSWECVTGRVDHGESFEEALHREVAEEIQIKIHPEFIIGTTHFYRDEAIEANELQGVIYACRYDGDRDAIQLSDEHDMHYWVTWDELSNYAPDDNWLYHAIERAEYTRQHMSNVLADYHTKFGFEGRGG